MKRILLAVVTSLVALSAAAYTTQAAWSHTVTVTNNQVTTGTADLKVYTNKTAVWDSSTSASDFTLTGIVPGSQIDGGHAFWLRNDSTTGVNFNLTGTITGSGAPEGTNLSIYVYDVGNTGNNSGWHTLNEWLAGTVPFGSTLAAGAQKDYGMWVKLDSGAGNEWINQTVTFSMVVTGTQI
jgi:hypothetical protein